jgi:hypothetical protein
VLLGVGRGTRGGSGVGSGTRGQSNVQFTLKSILLTLIENPQIKKSTLRRSRLIFIAVIIITALAIIWPGHAIFASAKPLILGFPLSFAWIILWVLIGFGAMLGLYLADSHDDHISGENK